MTETTIGTCKIALSAHLSGAIQEYKKAGDEFSTPWRINGLTGPYRISGSCDVQPGRMLEGEKTAGHIGNRS